MRSLLQRSTLCCCRVVQNTLCCFRGVQKHKHLHSREMELNCRRTYWGEKRNDVTINCWFPLLDPEKPSSMLVWYDDWVQRQYNKKSTIFVQSYIIPSTPVLTEGKRVQKKFNAKQAQWTSWCPLQCPEAKSPMLSVSKHCKVQMDHFMQCNTSRVSKSIFMQCNTSTVAKEGPLLYCSITVQMGRFMQSNSSRTTLLCSAM